MKHAWTLSLSILWLTCIGTGMGLMMRHENTPGAPAAPLSRWPTNAAIALDPDLAYTVVLLAHPRCPCTRASLHELARLSAQVEGSARIYVLFMLPADADDDWRLAPNWKLAADIPGVYVLSDPEGRQAAAFGAKTSGQTLIYDREGALRFRGGLTGSRGQEGENPAFNAAARLIREGHPPAGPLPVFGCPLQEEAPVPALAAAGVR